MRTLEIMFIVAWSIIVTKLRIYLKGSLARNGVEKYFDNYDDEAKAFWIEVERALHSSTRAEGISIEAQEVARTLEKLFSNTSEFCLMLMEQVFVN